MTTTVRQRIDLILDDTVAASSLQTNESGTIPANETWVLEKFGGSELGSGDNIASLFLLQEWDGATWTTVRMMGLSGCAFEYIMNRAFKGDGTKKLRIRRGNNSESAKRISAYIEGYKIPS